MLGLLSSKNKVLDLETSQGYRKYTAAKFRDGLRLMLQQIPEVREVLGIKMFDRTPATPKAMLTLIKHRHTTKQLPDGFSFSYRQLLDHRRDNMGDLVEFVGMTKTLVLFFKSGLRVGFKFERESSTGYSKFMYFRTQDVAHLAATGDEYSDESCGIVHTEGFFAEGL